MSPPQPATLLHVSIVLTLHSVSLAQVLLTAIPASLREIAATNIPAVSSILWEEFLDDNKPEWFLELPTDIQNYLIRRFGPRTAWPTEAPASSGVDATASGSAPASATDTDVPWQTSLAEPSGTSGGASQTDTDATESTQTPESTASSDLSSLATSAVRISTASTGKPTLLPTGSLTDSPTSSSTSDPDSPPASDSGLSKGRKIGIGVGVPLAILGAAALAFGCCFFLRRRRRKNVDGSLPPSSPGFIPRFAFQDRSAEHLEHRTPLNRDINHSTQDLGHMNWDDDVIEPAEPAPMHNPPPVMTMHDPKPIMAPALFHTHSSNRARGRRTSYTSLHSVAEVTEPDEESPVLGRDVSPPKQSPGRNLIPTPPIPAAAQIKRKPVATSPPMPSSPAAVEASRTLLRQTMPDHSGSSSSGLALTSSSGFNSSSSGLGLQTDAASPVSPVSNRAPSNPFNYDAYVEDYGPEYHHGYVDVEDGLYGGHTSLSRYPEPRRKSSKTEWPLRNIVGSHHRRKSSPLWDRIYEE